ncbi:hypothetical protein B0H63DRAFT_102728 [Podospora didyma]|uniref:Uncharacterized protein n=1 Tax=Podospora didyma TaxID=330526 RepID=A0AAE0U3W7_9PEZI|nr:hypothetical protein B0H63DRAFT_102728 [Podospora didyma]
MTSFMSFKHQFPDYCSAWSSGVATMRSICQGRAPTEAGDTVSFLAVARAIAETLTGEKGDSTFIDRFDSDLVRWKQLFPVEEDSLAFCEVANSMWGAELDPKKIFVDKDFNDKETLDLISTLIDSAREPLGLDNGRSSNGGGGLELQDSLRLWQRRRTRGMSPPDKQSTLGQGNVLRLPVPSLPPEYASDRNQGGPSFSGQRQAFSPEPEIRPPSFEDFTSSFMGLAWLPGLQWHAPISLDEQNVSPELPFVFDLGTCYAASLEVAKFLMRGTIFAILLFYFQDYQPCSHLLGVILEVDQLGSLSNRMSILSGYMQSARPFSASDYDAKPSVNEDTQVPKPSGGSPTGGVGASSSSSTITPSCITALGSRGWYGMLSGGGGTWM